MARIFRVVPNVFCLKWEGLPRDSCFYCMKWPKFVSVNI